jgi:hypothetical protein
MVLPRCFFIGRASREGVGETADDNDSRGRDGRRDGEEESEQRATRAKV